MTGPEAVFQSQVIDLARLFGWRVAHFRPAQTSRGWRTPVEADGAGFPDLTLVRAPELIIAELKSDKGTLSPNQAVWLDELGQVAAGVIDMQDRLADTGESALAQAATVEVYLWRPSDFDAIHRRLSRPRFDTQAAAA